MKVKMPSVMMPGRASGMITSQKTCQRPAPSISAASSSAGGIVSMNCRSRNVPNALKLAGTMSPV